MLNIALLLFIFNSVLFSQTDSIYVNVDKVPVLKSYRGDLQKALNKTLEYPIDDLINKNEGIVMVSFVVTADGNINNIAIKEGISSSFDEEAIAAVSQLKEWKPGKVNGKTVSTELTIPVHFKLTKDQLELANRLSPIYKYGKKPLFVLDHRKVEGLGQIEYYNVKSIRVIKGEKAIKLYGEGASDGVVVIETKPGTYPQYRMY